MIKYDSDIHHRRSVRLREYDYSQAGLYFITICVQEHKRVFGDVIEGKMVLNEYGKMANEGWLEIPKHYPKVVLHEFVIMPNHIHGILEIVGVEYFRPDITDDHNRVENIRPDITDDYNGGKNIQPDTADDYNGGKNIQPDTADDHNRVENIRPLRPNCKSGTIGAIVRGFKIGLTKQIGRSICQRNYYEHIIRDHNDYARIVDYIINNPANWINDRFYAN